MTRRRYLPIHIMALVILSLSVWLGACGSADKTTSPEYINPFLGAKVATDSTFEVMTWNLENFAKKGNTTTDLVVEILQGLETDLVGLQEIQSTSSFQNVVNGLDGWSGFKASSDSYMNLAFLYRTDGELEMTSVYEILSGNGREFPRTPLVFEGTFNGTPLVVINNHFKCCGNNSIDEDDPWDEETRRRDANQLLADYVANNYAGQRVIILGDFNDELDDDPINNVFNVFLNDTTNWLAVDMPIAEGPSSGWSYLGWPSHLDHILAYGPVLDDLDGPLTAIQTVPVHSYLSGGWGAYNTNVSDHLPVCLKLGF